MHSYLPPHWPAAVGHPDAPDFANRVTNWLLDLAPPEYRLEPVLRAHPVVLVRLVQRSIAARGKGVDLALAGLRSELADQVPAPVIEAAVDTLTAERRELLHRRRAVGLVEHVLRGGDFVEKM